MAPIDYIFNERRQLKFKDEKLNVSRIVNATCVGINYIAKMSRTINE